MTAFTFLVLWMRPVLVGQINPITCASVVQKAWPNYRVLAYVDAQLVSVMPNKAADGGVSFGGDAFYLLNVLAKSSNFTYSVTVQRSKEYGRKLPNGEWDGMIGALLDDKVDLVVAPWASTPERRKILSFVELQSDFSLGVLVNPKYGTKDVEYFSDEIFSHILNELDNPKAKAINEKMRANGRRPSLEEDFEKAALKVSSGKFAYVFDTDHVDEAVAFSGGRLARDRTTIPAPGYSVAMIAGKKGSPKTAKLIQQLSALTVRTLAQDRHAMSQG